LGGQPSVVRMAPMSSEYGTFELLYELPTSALSGGVGLGAGVGRGRRVVKGWLFVVTAPMARTAIANAGYVNLVIVLICLSLALRFPA